MKGIGVQIPRQMILEKLDSLGVVVSSPDTSVKNFWNKLQRSLMERLPSVMVTVGIVDQGTTEKITLAGYQDAEQIANDTAIAWSEIHTLLARPEKWAELVAK